MQGDNNNNSSICSSTVSFCPSFNSYASSKLVDIAAKVVERQENGVVNGGIAEDFEFLCDGIRVGSDDARELFVDGQIRQVFPVFNRALLLNEEDGYDNSPRKLRASLKNLFVEEGGGGGGGEGEGPPPPSSPSSSSSDELEAVPKDTYCVWLPKRDTVAASPNRSNSAGTSASSFKGWFKFPRLHRRSNSEGGHKDSFLFLHKKKPNADSKAPRQEGSKEAMVKRSGDSSKVKLSPLHEVTLSPSHEVFFMKNKAIKEADHKKRSSYMPHKQDFLGFFVNNVSSLGKTFAPF